MPISTLLPLLNATFDLVEADATKMTPDQIERILREAGLMRLGERSGKAGVMFGIDGMARRISVGKRDIMMNVAEVSITRPDMLARPVTRWAMEATVLLSKMTPEKLQHWCGFAKGGMTTKELLTLAREKYAEKQKAAAADAKPADKWDPGPIVIVRGTLKKQ